jgi:hypothetical protein
VQRKQRPLPTGGRDLRKIMLLNKLCVWCINFVEAGIEDIGYHF